MKKILIITFYGFKDYFLYIKEQLEILDYEVYDYPLFKYAYDVNDKIDKYEIHMNKYINEISPDIILWWFLGIPISVVKYIKDNHPNIFYIMHNSDDPVNVCEDILEKAKMFNLIISPCLDSVSVYKLYSETSNVIFTPSGYNPNIFYKIDDIGMVESKYHSDISFFCTDLYSGNKFENTQFIKRRILIDELVQYSDKNNKIFKLWGPNTLKQYYKNNYVSHLSNEELNLVYNCSKLNVTTHPFSFKNKCVSRDEITIFGSGGLVFMDKATGLDELFIPNKHCIYIDKDSIEDQLNDIFSNIKKYDITRNNAHKLVKNNYTWNHWIDTVHIEITKHFFSPNIYKELNNIVCNTNDLWGHWLKIGKSKGLLCTKQNIPSNFKYELYALDNNLSDKSKEYLYNHWSKNGKETKYSLIKNKSIDTGDLNLIPEICIDIFQKLNKIKNKNTTNEGLDDLQQLLDGNPGIDINKIIDKYINLCN